MAIKPIQFDTAAVRAILDGRKSKICRVIKPQPILTRAVWKFAGAMWREDAYCFRPAPGQLVWNRMPCHPGDVLWVREEWNIRNSSYDGDPLYCYKVDGRHYRAGHLLHEDEHWCAARYMPKEAARIFLRVSDVRIERLLDWRQKGNSGLYDTLWVWVISFEPCDMPKDWLA